MVKTCTKCGGEFPVTKEYFRAAKSSKDGFRRECKSCQDIQGKEYREKNKEKIAEKKKVYYEENKDELLEKSRKWHSENKDKASIRSKEYRKNNHDEILKKQRLHYQENRDKILDKNKEYYTDNKDSIREINKKWVENNRHVSNAIKKRWKERNPDCIKEYEKNNRDKHNERNKKYRSTEKGILTSNNHTNKRRARKKELEASLNKYQWMECKKYFDNKCCYCGNEGKLQQEHFIPLSKGGEYTINNIVVACKTCNCNKSDKDFFEWYPKQSFYSKKREQKILKYLNYDTKTKIQQLALI